MIANSAFLAAMILLLVVFVVFGQLEFLAPFKSLILTEYLWVIVGSLVVLFLNLFSAIYLIGRGLFLKDTGRKLAHVEKLLHTPDTVAHGLSERLAKDE
ncbi:MAG: hypothetical protein ABS36_06330 [Acidobacteria bacterium SCN 69-37]|nr:MAG: hypothetical protein ABS36_06330 [Acidobacteria bacterium SCN 69-37]